MIARIGYASIYCGFRLPPVDRCGQRVNLLPERCDLLVKAVNIVPRRCGLQRAERLAGRFKVAFGGVEVVRLDSLLGRLERVACRLAVLKYVESTLLTFDLFFD